MRWLLVLLLVWDQAGSPLHLHHHDSGVDAAWLTAAHDVDDMAHVPHPVQDADADSHFYHAVLGLWSQSGWGSPAAGAADYLVLAHVQVAVAFALVAMQPPPPWPPDRYPPPYASYRSLPPAGRAPPLHA